MIQVDIKYHTKHIIIDVISIDIPNHLQINSKALKRLYPVNQIEGHFFFLNLHCNLNFDSSLFD